MAPRQEGHTPYGFAIFEKEGDAQKCLTARKLTIDGETVVFSPATNRKSNKLVNGAGGDGMSSGKSHSHSSLADLSQTGSQSKAKGQPPAVYKFRAIMSYYKSLDELYIQDVSGNKATEYFRLQEQLKGHCSRAAQVTKPDKKKMYAGLFTEDQSWYRCRVVKVNDNKTYEVQFVDYGNKSEVSKESLKELEDYMASVPEAARKCHVQGLVPRPNCSDQVDRLMGSWLETILECECQHNYDIDLFNRETGASLRETLISSGLVAMSSSSNSSLNSNSKKKKPRGAAVNGSAECEVLEVEAIASNRKKCLNKLDLEEESKMVDRSTSIDFLNTQLNSKLMAVRLLRLKCPLSMSEVSEEVKGVLSSASYSKDVHDAIFDPVSSLYSQYCTLQEQLSQLQPSVDSLDPALVDKRNEMRRAFCEAVKVVQCKCDELGAPERKATLNSVLAKLSELCPELDDETFDGNVEETIAKFNDWQEKEGETTRQLQKDTDEALASLAGVMEKQRAFIRQSLNLEVDVEKPEDLAIISPTQLAISQLDKELKVVDESQGKPLHDMVCCLRSMIGREFSLLEEMQKELTKLQNLSSTLEPWLGVSEPERLDWLHTKEKKLKELRSHLRHRLADLDDLKENEDESDSEIADMEVKVNEVRDEIHGVLIELERYIEDLSHLTETVFPEFALQYPKLCLRKVKEDRSRCIKPLRDFNFYKDNGTTRSTFNGEEVIVKAYNAPTGETNHIPALVGQLMASGEFKHLVKLEAVFFSKKGTTTYLQLRSENADVMNYMADTPVLDLEPLTLFLSQVTSLASAMPNTQNGETTTEHTSS